MSQNILSTVIQSESHMAQLATAIGKQLQAGDTILLHGDIGAGKSYFARQLIQSLQENPEDVPSPTFTLVQCYNTCLGEIWHADLYRLSGADDIIELGLYEAFETDICLVEWPDRLGDLTPPNPLNMEILVNGSNTRNINFRWNTDYWEHKIKHIIGSVCDGTTT